MALRCQTRRLFQQICDGVFKYSSRPLSSLSPPNMGLVKPADEILEDQDVAIDYMKESLKHPDYFKVANTFTVEDLFKARVHLGHRDGLFHKNMTPFVYGSRLGHVIIDLDRTAEHLRQALNFAAHIAFREGIIVFVSRSPQHQVMVENFAKDCGEYSHCRFWMGGTLTNSTLEFGCVTRLPDLMIFLNTLDTAMLQHVAVRDAAKMLIPTIGIVDSNCDPNLITYPVPGNDDTTSAIHLYGTLFKNAILKGKEKRRELLGQ